MKLRIVGPLALAALALVSLYADVVVGLLRAWHTNDDYSHGFLVAPLCGYFIWERRHRLASLDTRPSLAGLVIILVSLLLLIAGELGAELFLARVSLLGVLAGSVMFALGPLHARMLALPLCFGLLMIPLPAIVFNAVAFPLQLLASRVAEVTLSALSIPVFREGNVIFLATTTLEVAEACSGIRSLVSLLTLGIVYGYFTEDSVIWRVILAAATLPIAVIANALRVAGTGFLAHVAGAAAADGFFHTFAGWLVFMAAVIMLFLVQRLLRLTGSDAATPSPVGGVVL
jgi:exosortase